jgi:hypothetical protein
MKTLCLISCVKKKKNYKCKAEDMYISTLFKYSLEYAQRHFDEVAILSAKYGLLRLDKEIEPYEMTLNNMKDLEIRKWSINVTNEIKRIYPEYEYHVIAGKNYYKYLNIKIEALFPLSIGKKLQALKNALVEKQEFDDDIW